MLLLCIYYSIENKGRNRTFKELVKYIEEKINSEIINQKRYVLTKALQYIKLKYNRVLTFRYLMNMHLDVS